MDKVLASSTSDNEYKHSHIYKGNQVVAAVVRRLCSCCARIVGKGQNKGEVASHAALLSLCRREADPDYIHKTLTPRRSPGRLGESVIHFSFSDSVRSAPNMVDTTTTLVDAPDALDYLSALVTDRSAHGRSVRAAWLRAAKQVENVYLKDDFTSETVPECADSETNTGETEHPYDSEEEEEEAFIYVVDFAIPEAIKSERKLVDGCACDETHIRELMLLITTFARNHAAIIGRVRENERRRTAPQDQFLWNFLKDLFWIVGTTLKSERAKNTELQWKAQFEALQKYCEANLSTPDNDSMSEGDIISVAGPSSFQAARETASPASARTMIFTTRTSGTSGSGYQPTLPAATSSGSVQSQLPDLWCTDETLKQ